ncbi:immunoglobulin superfamily member 10-like [Saccostrea cucullata]|uniref:immunoglobulin superfamily member 10-like n=1 Tax=Saccostrea cuccullata TaxID=36930 RepID=UPI002ED6BF79
MSKVRLPCQSQITKEPVTVIWKKTPGSKILFFNERSHTNDDKYSLGRKYRDDWTLVIDTLLKRHEGDYVCLQISRGVRTTLKEYTLRLNGPPQIPPSTPWSIKRSVKEGDTVDLWCNVSSPTKPYIHWFTQESGQLYPIHVSGPLLQIRNISRFCATKHVCLAENEYSESPINMTFDTEVKFAAQILLYDARPIKKDLRSTTLFRKSDVEVILRCDVMASPDIEIFWKFRKCNNSELQELASYTSGKGISKTNITENIYRFKINHVPEKSVTMFDIIFTTSQNLTFSTYVCEAESDKFPSEKKSIAVVQRR